MDLPVFDLKGKKTEAIELDEARWSPPANLRLLNQVMRMYRANRRTGAASTKTRGDVSGGGKKPWKQKHTGRARVGSIRSPLWRHGGIVFGPHPRDMGYQLPKTLRRRALFESLKGKLHDQELVVVNRLQASEPKTKPFAHLAKTFGVNGHAIIVLEEFNEPLVKSLRNLPAFQLHRADDLNAFDVINAQKVLVTRSAFDRIDQRLLTHPSADAPTSSEQPASPAAKKAPAKKKASPDA